MGIPGLNNFIRKHGSFILRDYDLRATRLIIDGHNVCHKLFNAFQPNVHYFGGDYDRFAQVCKDFFTALRHRDVVPYVIYDGAYDTQKLATILKRSSDRIRTADKISQGKIGMVLPVMSYETFRDVVESMGIDHVTCNFDADHQAAALAIRWKCPILTMDMDFLIYNLPEGVVLVDFMNIQEFVKEADIGKCPIATVKIYQVGAVLGETGSSDPRILPLWATLLGNDRADRELFAKFFRAVQLPLACGRIQADGVNDRSVGVLGWLGSRLSFEDALETILSLYSAEERPDLESAIRTSMMAYTDLTCEVEGHFSDTTKSDGGTPLDSFAGRRLPDWFMVGIRSGRIPVHALDAIVLRRVILPTQVSLTSQPSPYQCSVTLRRFLYSVLLLWDESAPQLGRSFIEEHDRDQNLQLKCERVHALVHLDSGGRVPSLEEIPRMTEHERMSVLMEALGVTWSQLADFEPQTHLLIATVVFWMRKSSPAVDSLHLETLLVCFRRAGILGNARGDRIHEVSLEGLCETPNEISSRTFDCSVVHAFAQFQCCLQMAIYVNQILLLPAPKPFPVLAFSGTFLHNFYRKLVTFRCQQRWQQEQQMQHHFNQEQQLYEQQEREQGWQQQRQPRRKMRQQPYEQRPQQQLITPRQQQQQQRQQHVRHEQLQARIQPWQHEQNRQQYEQQKQPLQYDWQGQSLSDQDLLCSSAGVNSENPNPLETACADIAIYRDRLLSII